MDGSLNNFLDSLLRKWQHELMSNLEKNTKKQFIDFLVSAASNVMDQFPNIQSIRWVQSKPIYDWDVPVVFEVSEPMVSFLSPPQSESWKNLLVDSEFEDETYFQVPNESLEHHGIKMFHDLLRQLTKDPVTLKRLKRYFGQATAITINRAGVLSTQPVDPHWPAC